MDDGQHSFDSEPLQAADFQPCSVMFPDMEPIRSDVRLAPVADDRYGTSTRSWVIPTPPQARSAAPMDGRVGTGRGFPGRENVVRVPHPSLYLDTPVKSGLENLRRVESPCLISTLEQFREDKLKLAEFLLAKGEKRKAAEVRTCGDYLEIGWDGKAMREVVRDDDHGGVVFEQRPGSARVLGGDLCDQYKICPVCAHIMAMRRFSKVLPQVQCLLHDQEAELLPVLVTLTVKNGHDLGERYRHLMTSLGKLHKLAKNARQGQRFTEFARIHGALWSTEFTWSEAGWHPHLHGVCLIRKADVWSWIDDKRQEGWKYPFPFDVNAMRADWEAITQDSRVLHVRPFDMVRDLVNDPSLRQSVCSNADRLAGGLLEALKYATKIEQGNFDQRWDVAQETHAKHLIRRWGCLRKVKPCPVLERVSSPPFVGAFGWSSKAGRYELEHVRGWDHTRDHRDDADE